MENTLKKLWYDLSPNQKEHILKCLSNNSLCNNPSIDQYLINHNSSFILNKLSNIVGGASQTYDSKIIDSLKEKINLIEKEKKELILKSKEIKKQKDELIEKINKCDSKLSETEEIIKELTKDNEKIEEEKSSLISRITTNLQSLIQSL